MCEFPYVPDVDALMACATQAVQAHSGLVFAGTVSNTEGAASKTRGKGYSSLSEDNIKTLEIMLRAMGGSKDIRLQEARLLMELPDT